MIEGVLPGEIRGQRMEPWGTPTLSVLEEEEGSDLRSLWR